MGRRGQPPGLGLGLRKGTVSTTASSFRSKDAPPEDPPPMTPPTQGFPRQVSSVSAGSAYASTFDAAEAEAEGPPVLTLGAGPAEPPPRPMRVRGLSRLSSRLTPASDNDDSEAASLVSTVEQSDDPLQHGGGSSWRVDPQPELRVDAPPCAVDAGSAAGADARAEDPGPEEERERAPVEYNPPWLEGARQKEAAPPSEGNEAPRAEAREETAPEAAAPEEERERVPVEYQGSRQKEAAPPREVSEAPCAEAREETAPEAAAERERAPVEYNPPWLQAARQREADAVEAASRARCRRASTAELGLPKSTARRRTKSARPINPWEEAEASLYRIGNLLDPGYLKGARSVDDAQFLAAVDEAQGLQQRHDKKPPILRPGASGIHDGELPGLMKRLATPSPRRLGELTAPAPQRADSGGGGGTRKVSSPRGRPTLLRGGSPQGRFQARPPPSLSPDIAEALRRPLTSRREEGEEVPVPAGRLRFPSPLRSLMYPRPAGGGGADGDGDALSIATGSRTGTPSARSSRTGSPSPSPSPPRRRSPWRVGARASPLAASASPARYRRTLTPPPVVRLSSTRASSPGAAKRTLSGGTFRLSTRASSPKRSPSPNLKPGTYTAGYARASTSYTPPRGIAAPPPRHPLPSTPARSRTPPARSRTPPAVRVRSGSPSAAVPRDPRQKSLRGSREATYHPGASRWGCYPPPGGGGAGAGRAVR